MPKNEEPVFQDEEAARSILWTVFNAAALARAVPGCMGSALAEDAAKVADAAVQEAEKRGIVAKIIAAKNS